MERAIRVQLLQQNLRVTADYQKQVVEIMRDAARQPSHRFHLLCLPELVFEHALLGDILGDNFQEPSRLISTCNGAPAEPDRDEG